jgi:hypothetical protein
VSANHADYVKVISTLPSYDAPGMFGLPANIDRVVQRAQSSAVLAQLKQLVCVRMLRYGRMLTSVQAVPTSLSTQFNREEWATQMKPVLKLWKQVGRAWLASMIAHITLLHSSPERTTYLKHASTSNPRMPSLSWRSLCGTCGGGDLRQ